jgi:arylsulfatase A-like enzyme
LRDEHEHNSHAGRDRTMRSPGRAARWLPALAGGALIVLVAAIGIGLYLRGGPGSAPSGPPPSVLLISIETLRPDYLSMNGYDRPTSPYLDTLLSEGFYFQRAITPIPRTTPALASLLTGAYPHTTLVQTLHYPLSDEVTSIAQVLQEDGYQTIAVVTNRMLTPERKLDRGFGVYDHDEANVRDAAATTSAALAHFTDLDAASPLFAWIHYFDPHVPYHCEPEIARAFDPDYRGRYQLHFGLRPEPTEKPFFQPYPEDLPKPIAVHHNPLPEAVNEHVRRLYAAGIRSLDDQLERLVQGARALYGENLIIIVTADHGESLGEHDFYFDHGDYVYNAGTRVPLGVILPSSHPAHRRGVCTDWVSLVDVVPTLLDLLGRPIPPAMGSQIEGRSLLPYILGEPVEPQPVFAECGQAHFPESVKRRKVFNAAGRFRAVVLGDWKLIYTPFASPEPEWQLFNVRLDPHETIDHYSPEHPEVPALERHLAAWLEKAVMLTRTVSDEDIEALRSLGYIR